MAPWWGQEARGGGGGGGTPVVVKMQTPDWAISEVPPPGSPAAGGKDGRGKNARQITWVLLLKAHRAAGKLTGAASAALSVAAAARRRVAAGRTDSDAPPAPGEESPALRTRFYGFLRGFLLLSVLLLAADVAAHAQGWHLVGLEDVEGLFAAAYGAWMRARAAYLGPALQFLTNACVVLFMIQSADRLILCLGCFWIKLRGIKPVPNVAAAGKGADDVEAGLEFFPMVLVQIPMCNEKEVYQQSIGAVCNLDWPRSNFLVQVLDDSDDVVTSALIKEEVEKWQREGVRILYRHRVIRDGYKAGNLKSAMNCSYVKDYEFVVIFDADFQPQEDFLKLTVPHFKGKEDVGLVQASRLMGHSSISLGSTEPLECGESRHSRTLEDGWREQQLKTWILLSEHISRDGSFCILMMLSASVNCRNHMKHIESNNIDGILVRCSCSDSALWTSSDQRLVFGRSSTSYSFSFSSANLFYPSIPSHFSVLSFP
ncbi:hypothetical protein ACQ4PT_042464 [Festuca glaucescens]